MCVESSLTGGSIALSNSLTVRVNTGPLNLAWDQPIDRGCRSSQCQSAESHGILLFPATAQSVWSYQGSHESLCFICISLPRLLCEMNLNSQAWAYFLYHPVCLINVFDEPPPH